MIIVIIFQLFYNFPSIKFYDNERSIRNKKRVRKAFKNQKDYAS